MEALLAQLDRLANKHQLINYRVLISGSEVLIRMDVLSDCELVEHEILRSAPDYLEHVETEFDVRSTMTFKRLAQPTS